MMETEKLSLGKNILRALRLNNMFGKPSNIEENIQLDLQDNQESLNLDTWVRDKNALLEAERKKAEALMIQQKQRFIQ
jgi:hypothetical protein